MGKGAEPAHPSTHSAMKPLLPPHPPRIFPYMVKGAEPAHASTHSTMKPLFPPHLSIYGQRGGASTSLHPHCHNPPLFSSIYGQRGGASTSPHPQCDEAPPPLVSPYMVKRAEPAHASTHSVLKPLFPPLFLHIWAKGRSQHIPPPTVLRSPPFFPPYMGKGAGFQLSPASSPSPPITDHRWGGPWGGFPLPPPPPLPLPPG